MSIATVRSNTIRILQNASRKSKNDGKQILELEEGKEIFLRILALSDVSYTIIDALEECDDREPIFDVFNEMLDSKSPVKDVSYVEATVKRKLPNS